MKINGSRKQNGHGPTGGTDQDDVSAGSSINGHGPTGGTDQDDVSTGSVLTAAGL
jgi:hypothetical protein